MGVRRRLSELLAREDWIYLLSLLVPLLVYDLILKVVRIVSQLDVPGPLGFLDQARSDVFFSLGYAALWIGIFAVARRGLARWLALIVFHVAAMVLILLTTTAHFFYESTGSVLDYDFIAFSFGVFEETRAVLATETTPLHWLLLSAALLYAVAGPAVVTRLANRDWHVPVRTTGRPWAAPLAVCLGALVLGILSLLPSATGASKSFSRDAAVHVLMTGLGEPADAANPEIKTELAAEDLPTDTTLTATSFGQRNVVMVFMETTRAQSSTPYNEDLKTTPFMAELAENSLVAERAYAVLPHTSKAMTAAHCGVPPPLDTNMTESEPGAIPARCIPDLLKEQGYRTVFFQSATEDFERRRQLVQEFGYEEFYPVETMDKEGFETANYFGYEDAIMLGPSSEWLQRNGSNPFVATYLTVTAHHDYTVPDRYGGEKKFVEDPEVNRYLNTLHYQDAFLRELFQQYKDLGLYEDTVFIVMADHGEGFGEHGLYQHDNTIYNEGLKIPILIHDPLRFAGGGRVEVPVNHMDVLPTVMDLLGYGIQGGTYPGESLLGAPPKDRVLMASCYHENKCLASIKGDHKYIYHYGNKPDEYFYLAEDPHELHNIADEHPEEIEKRRNALLEWKSRVDATYDRRVIYRQETTGSE